MKKYYFLLSLIFLSVISGKTQITFSSIPDTIYCYSNDWLLETHVEVYNNTNNTLQLIVERYDSVSVGNDFYFCWGANCYTPAQTISTDTVTLAPGDSTGTFSAYMKPNGNSGIAKVFYNFKDINGLDSSGFSLIYKIIDTTTTFTQQVKKHSEIIVFPNPVNKQFTLYTESSIEHVGLISATGKTIYYWNPKEEEKTFFLPEISDGVYFLKIKTVSGYYDVKRIVIKH